MHKIQDIYFAVVYAAKHTTEWRQILAFGPSGSEKSTLELHVRPLMWTSFAKSASSLAMSVPLAAFPITTTIWRGLYKWCVLLISTLQIFLQALL
jgi:hypothetical protein